MKYSSAFVRQLTQREGRPWQGVLKYKGSDGKPKQATKVFDREKVKTEAAARKALARWRNDMERAAEAKEAGGVALVPKGQTVAQYCAAYIDGQEALHAIEKSTVRDYRNSLHYLDDGIAEVPVRDLTRGMVERWEAALMGRGLSASTTAKAHRFLRLCMKHAREVGDLPRDPTEGVKPPKRPSGRRPTNSLDPEQRVRLARLVDGMRPSPVTTAVALALYTGMREGEICALRWRDVDLDAGSLWVVGAIGVGPSGTYEKDTKSDRARDVPVSAQLGEVLRARRSQVLDECAEAGVAFSKDMYVTGRIDGAYMQPATLARKWHALAEAHGLTGTDGRALTFHGLRHTFASAMIAGGVDVVTVSNILGHADSSMTLDIYATPDPEAKRAAGRAAGALIGGGRR